MCDELLLKMLPTTRSIPQQAILTFHSSQDLTSSDVSTAPSTDSENEVYGEVDSIVSGVCEGLHRERMRCLRRLQVLRSECRGKDGNQMVLKDCHYDEASDSIFEQARNDALMSRIQALEQCLRRETRNCLELRTQVEHLKCENNQLRRDNNELRQEAAFVAEENLNVHQIEKSPAMSPQVRAEHQSSKTRDDLERTTFGSTLNPVFSSPTLFPIFMPPTTEARSTISPAQTFKNRLYPMSRMLHPNPSRLLQGSFPTKPTSLSLCKPMGNNCCWGF